MRGFKIRHMVSALLLGAFFLGGSVSALAANQSGTVRMSLPPGDQPAIVFESGSSFSTFDNVVPGDVLTQEIILENKRNEPVEFFLKTLSPHSSHLLDRLTIEIKNETCVLYKGNPDGIFPSLYGAEVNPRGIGLGQWPSKSTHRVTLTMAVPLDLDHTHVEEMASIQWQVRAEMKASSTKDEKKNSDGTSTLDRDTARGTTGDNTVNIQDWEIPLSDHPLYTIAPNQVPLANLPKTGGGSGKFPYFLENGDAYGPYRS